VRRKRFLWWVTAVDQDFWPISDEHECSMVMGPLGSAAVEIRPVKDLLIPVTEEGYVDAIWLLFTDVKGKEMMKWPVGSPDYIMRGHVLSMEGAVKYDKAW